MELIERVRENERVFPHVVLTLGSFDGVHRGHRLILDAVVQAARAAGGTAAVLTMRPHPRQFFAPDHAPNLLTSDEKKFALFAAAGVDVTFVLEFNAETANLPAEEFVRGIIHERCHAREVIVGHDCRFGKGARGDYATLESLGPRYNFSTRQVPPLIVEGERISSTLIRERVLQADLDEVEKLLGRKYSIVGEVVTGRGIGRKLGFPTANIRPHHSAIPAQGVYIAEAFVDGVRKPAAVNIGIAPTIRHEDITVEAYLLDFDGELPGKRIELIFHRRIRPEKKFASITALTEQIAADVEETRAYFAADV
ncbi:MAG: bifunctional riboflavin kinase/FAD synthetase [Candidatus Hydrogenedentales bacterium]